MEALLFSVSPDPCLVVEWTDAKYVHSFYTSPPPKYSVYVLVSKDLNPEITGVFTCVWFDGTVNIQINNNRHEFTCDVLTGRWSVFAGPEQRRVGKCDPAIFTGLLPPVQTGVSPKHNTDATRFLTEEFSLNKLFLKIKTL